MSITVYDKTIKTVVCVNGELSVEEKPRRDVTLTRDSVPELPGDINPESIFDK